MVALDRIRLSMQNPHPRPKGGGVDVVISSHHENRGNIRQNRRVEHGISHLALANFLHPGLMDNDGAG